MFKTVKRHLKNQKGLTLIELLAVVVILGIIAAIAIPAIGGLIDNSKKDAHVANATQLINSAKTWAAGNAQEISTAAPVTLSLNDFYEEGLIDKPMKDPDGGDYEDGGTTTGSTTGSFVIIKQTGTSYTYEVKLINDTPRGIWELENDLERSAVSETLTDPTP